MASPADRGPAPPDATLATAIEHLRAFRTALYDGDEVDEASGLNAADLDILLAAAERQLAEDRGAH